MTSLGTIGVAFPGDPQARGTWSGTPAGLAAGLADLGFAVRRIDARPARLLDTLAFNAVAAAHVRPGPGGPRAALRGARMAARVSPTVARVRGAGLAARLRAGDPLDAIVQIGTGYTVPAGLPVATFEDMTIPQAVALRYPGWVDVSARAIAARQDGQRRAYSRATACCLATQWAADSVTGDYGVPAGKVHAVGIGRNHDPVPPAERRWEHPRFLFVGMDWIGKNGPGVLEAFAALRADHPDAELHVVGEHPPLDGPGVVGHGVMRMGDAADRRRLADLYGLATCLVLPSHREAAGIAYVEAMTAGLAVIGSAAGGAGDLIGGAGCVVDPADRAGLLAAMRELSRPEVARRHGAVALERAPLFTWRAVAARVAAALGLAGGAFDVLPAPFREPVAAA
jgi:glycosyltransferase involved in cell wall biosynthesis